MTLAHDLHMARLRIARLEEVLRDAVAALGGIKSDNVPDTVREALGEPGSDGDILSEIIAHHNALYDRWRKSFRRHVCATLGITQPASSPRPAPDPCEASGQPQEPEGAS